MSEDATLENLLSALDRPATPRAAFSDALLDRLVVELNGPAQRLRRGRRLVLALAAAVAMVVVATAVAAALGHDVFGGLGSWLSGSPGRPASHGQEAGFARRNGASYAAFPAHTRLRLLQTRSHRHKSFSLLGFRNGPALCLRLVPTRTPAALGVNQCVSLRELRSARAPALAASTAHFRSLDAVFGFADDSVRTLEVRHLRGDRQLVRVANNSFVELHGPSNPIVSVVAQTRDGRTVAVPFAPALGVQAPNGVPSYVGMLPVHLAGPVHAVPVRRPSRVSWLARREPRGAPFAVDARFLHYLGGSQAFARSVQPDPSDPYRLGIALIRLGRGAPPAILSFSGRSPARVGPGDVLLCLFELFPLRARPLGGLCGPSSAGGLSDAVLTRVMFRELFTRVSGLAGDTVRTIELILADGRVVPVPVRNNVYTVEAPSDEFPAKLVAYDSAHRPVAVDVVPTDERPVVRPCPAPNTGRAAAPAPPYDRLDLATGRVDGHLVLGRPLGEVEAAFGRPASTSPPRVTPSMRSLTIGYGTGLAIGFHRAGRGFRAVSLEYRDPRLVVRGIGHALRLPPTELERRIASAAGGRYRLVAAYGSRPSRLGCLGVFQARASGGGRLVFGVDPGSRRPSLVILGAPASSGPPPGTYVTKITAADLVRVGLSREDAHWETLTLRVDGTWRDVWFHPRAADQPPAHSRYVVEGDRIRLLGTPDTLRWKYARGRLTFTVVHVPDRLARLVYTAHAWTKIR
jgi:hypothetical protein